jgi:hypothetical protein
MAKRIACLLDVGFGTLHASAASAASMQACLAGRGFTTHLYRGAEVTRASVEALLKAAHAELAAGDTFVLYFVGHGDKVRDPTIAPRGDGPPRNAEVMLLITHDLFVTDAPLPGIAGAELLAWLAPLAARTGNVTLILDCCRAASLVPGAPVDPAVLARIDATLRAAAPALRGKYEVTRSEVTRSFAPAIVRLVATTRNDYAVEHTGPAGAIGLFTDSLVRVLADHPDDDRAWDQLIEEVQARVLAVCPSQRPGVEGPRHRLPFSRRERLTPEEHPCRPGERGWIVDAGALHGVEVGDRFVLADQEVAVHRVEPDRAHLTVDARRMLTTTPRPTHARRIACARQDVVTWPTSDLPTTDALELRLHHGDTTDAIGRVEAGVLRDRDGAILHTGAPGLLAAAARLARWHRQAPVFAALASDALIHVAWGRIGETTPLPREGAELRAGERVWVHAWGTGARPEVFVSLLRRRADLALLHLDDLDHGVAVARSSVDLTAASGGLQLAWSTTVPPDGPRDEALYLLVSAQPRSFHRVSTTATACDHNAPAPVRGGEPGLAVVRLGYRLRPQALGPNTSRSP